MILRRWIVKPPLTRHQRKGAVILLPGRGVPGNLMLRFSREMELRRTLLACMEPYRLVWYPQPNGPKDQTMACKGLEVAVEMVSGEIDRFMEWQGLKPEETALLGFSAGSVVALEVAMRSTKRFAACVSLSGAILEPHNVPEAKNETPIILQHNADDDCFKWHERYVPMREALREKGHNLSCLERHFGSHTLYRDDAINVSRLISPALGYPKGFAKKYLDTKIRR